jgi:hypothetical protein
VCACSWRVPFSAGVGPLSIVASQDLGGAGVIESSPVVVHWRWYHHVPSLGLWGVLVALLLLVPANRSAQAWLIVLPVLAIQLGWSMLARLLSLPVAVAENFGGVLVALTVSWAAVWLLAPWLSRRLVPVGLVLALVLMSVVGAVYSFSAYDMGSMDQAGFSIVSFALGSFLLLSSTVLAAFSCRRWQRPEFYWAWLLLWIMVVALVLPMVLGGILLVGPIIALSGGGAMELAFMLASMLIGLLIVGGLSGAMIYLVNLPFLLLARKSPLYRARFENALRLVSDPMDAMLVAQSEFGEAAVDPSPPVMVKES